MQRLTELEAINRMLLGIRLAPAASLDDIEVYSEGLIAKSILKQTVIEVLTMGWRFNTRRMTITPDAQNKIKAPTGTLDVFAPQSSRVDVIVDSDDYIMDIATNSKIFLTPLDVFVVIGYTWSQLPATLQLLCLHKARLSFKLEMKSEAGQDSAVIFQDILRAEANVRSWDNRQLRSTMLDSLYSQRHIDQNRER